MGSDTGERMCGDKSTKGHRKGRKSVRVEDKINYSPLRSEY
jgi:cobalamin biosynthesis protein CobD/CbiB